MDGAKPAAPPLAADADGPLQQAYAALVPLHSHHPICGAPVLFDPESGSYSDLADGQAHVCDTAGGEFVCQCGEILARSRHGWVYENGRGGPRVHRCLAEHDAADRELAMERRRW